MLAPFEIGDLAQIDGMNDEGNPGGQRTDQEKPARRLWPVAHPRLRQRLRHGRRDLLLQHRVERLFEGRFLALERGQGRLRVRIAGQQGFDFERRLARKLAIGIGAKDPIVDFSLSYHFTRLSRGSLSPSNCCRKNVRARDKRDITVPIGTPVISATSR